MKIDLQVILVAALATLLLIANWAARGAQEPTSPASRLVVLKYGDQGQTDFLKAVLASMKLKYTAKATSDGEEVQWASSDPVQEQEIRNRVSQYWFITTQCKDMRPPPPDKPAASQPSC